MAGIGLDNLDFDEHARDEMRHDSVSEDEVYHVVGDADEEIHRQDGRVRYERVLEDGRQIIVIVDETGTVKTVWWNKRGGRRRRR